MPLPPLPLVEGIAAGDEHIMHAGVVKPEASHMEIHRARDLRMPLPVEDLSGDPIGPFPVAIHHLTGEHARGELAMLADDAANRIWENARVDAVHDDGSMTL